MSLHPNLKSIITQIEDFSKADNVKIHNLDVLLSAIAILHRVEAEVVIPRIEKKLSNVRIVSLKTRKKSDVVEFMFETARGEYGPYKSSLPVGSIVRLGLVQDHLYDITSVKENGVWDWVEVVELGEDADDEEDDLPEF